MTKKEYNEKVAYKIQAHWTALREIRDQVKEFNLNGEFELDDAVKLLNEAIRKLDEASDELEYQINGELE